MSQVSYHPGNTLNDVLRMLTSYARHDERVVRGKGSSYRALVDAVPGYAGNHGLVVLASTEYTQRVRFHTTLAGLHGCTVPNWLPHHDAYTWDGAHEVPADVINIDLKLLARGSMCVNYHDVVRGERVDGYAADFISMTQALQAAVKPHLPPEKSGLIFQRQRQRELLWRMFAYGNLAATIKPNLGELLLAARLSAPEKRVLAALRSGELRQYVATDMPLGYIDALMGV